MKMKKAKQKQKQNKKKKHHQTTTTTTTTTLTTTTTTNNYTMTVPDISKDLDIALQTLLSPLWSYIISRFKNNLYNGPV